MLRSIPLLALGLTLGFSAAAFLALNPPPAFRLIRYDESMAGVFEAAAHMKDSGPCAAYYDSEAKYAACRKALLHPPAAKPTILQPPRYKMADPFWDRA